MLRRSLLAVVLLIGSENIARADNTTIGPDAKQHFQAGVAFLQDPDGEKVEEAYREFKVAFDLSQSPKVLGNMGLCAMKLERDGEAIDAYSRYLREVPDIDAEERAQIVRDLQTLTVGVSRITIEVDKPGASIVDVRVPVRGERVTNVYGPVKNGKIEVGIRPGHHAFTARLAGHDDQIWETEVYAGGKDKHAFAMPVHVDTRGGGSQAPSRSTNAGPYVVMGVGGAMIVAGAITGVVALGKSNDISDKCPNDTCPKSFDLDDARSSARTWVRVTDVLLIGGGVVALGGVGWWFFSREPGGADKAAKITSPLGGFTAGCLQTGCSAAYMGKF